MLCFLAMQAFQLAVASLLCYGGASFIGHTIVLSDLILNCIALEFVLEIDIALFASFAPRRLKGALAKSAELVAASMPTFHAKLAA